MGRADGRGAARNERLAEAGPSPGKAAVCSWWETPPWNVLLCLRATRNPVGKPSGRKWRPGWLQPEPGLCADSHAHPDPLGALVMLFAGTCKYIRKLLA